eukprot:12922544-Prorocentrum_lima.AAC.1
MLSPRFIFIWSFCNCCFWVQGANRSANVLDTIAVCSVISTYDIFFFVDSAGATDPRPDSSPTRSGTMSLSSCGAGP